MVDEGHFNDELFYRVASLPVALPPLRERKEDIPLLVKHFTVRATNPLVDTNLIEFTDDAMAVLMRLPLAGQPDRALPVRLQDRRRQRRRGSSPRSSCPCGCASSSTGRRLRDFLSGQEKQYMDRVLHACRGDKSVAAKVLGVDVARLG